MTLYRYIYKSKHKNSIDALYIALKIDFNVQIHFKQYIK